MPIGFEFDYYFHYSFFSLSLSFFFFLFYCKSPFHPSQDPFTPSSCPFYSNTPHHIPLLSSPPLPSPPLFLGLVSEFASTICLSKPSYLVIIHPLLPLTFFPCDRLVHPPEFHPINSQTCSSAHRSINTQHNQSSFCVVHPTWLLSLSHLNRSYIAAYPTII